MCYVRPRNRMISKKTMRRLGKHGRKWLSVRQQWFNDHPAQHYVCHYCGERLTRKETTLDHLQSRSRHPELRYDLSNLAPCCWKCNTEKGSQDAQDYKDNLSRETV